MIPATDVLATLNLIAFACHTVTELAEELWRKCLEHIGVRSYFFSLLRSPSLPISFSRFGKVSCPPSPEPAGRSDVPFVSQTCRVSIRVLISFANRRAIFRTRGHQASAPVYCHRSIGYPIGAPGM